MRNSTPFSLSHRIYTVKLKGLEMSHYVYFITYAREENPVKIGITKDMQRRLGELQTGNPNLLKIGYHYELQDEQYALKLETMLHKRYAIRQLQGEWFGIDLAVIMSDLKWAIQFTNAVHESDAHYYYAQAVGFKTDAEAYREASIIAAGMEQNLQGVVAWELENNAPSDGVLYCHHMGYDPVEFAWFWLKNLYGWDETRRLSA